MSKNIKNEINKIGAKIDIIESINNALICSLCGIDNFSPKDSCNYVSLLENRIKDLKKIHENLSENLDLRQTKRALLPALLYLLYSSLRIY